MPKFNACGSSAERELSRILMWLSFFRETKGHTIRLVSRNVRAERKERSHRDCAWGWHNGCPAIAKRRTTDIRVAFF
jgi:hypothetical protein